MILCSDFTVRGNQHIPFNQALLKIISQVYPNDTILFYGEKKHISILKEKKVSVNILYKEKLFSSSGERFKIFLKEFLEIVSMFHFFLTMKNDSCNLIIIFSIHPITHYVLKIVKHFYPNVNLFIVLHGELEYMKEKKKYNLKFFGSILKSALKLKCDKSTNYIVLGEVIKNNLLSIVHGIEDHIYYIDHPYEYCEVKKNEPDFDHLRISTIGIATLRKNAHLMFKLGQNLNKRYGAERFSLGIIGILHKSVLPFVNRWIDYSESDKPLDMDFFENQIEKIDYAIFFYDDNCYELCASGAFFDAIKFEKPIIATRNAFFEHYFEKLGNIGYLCDNFEALEELVVRLSDEKPLDEYIIQQENMRLAKHKLNINAISDQLKQII